jgi:hypothetical protein
MGKSRRQNGGKNFHGESENRRRRRSLIGRFRGLPGFKVIRVVEGRRGQYDRI